MHHRCQYVVGFVSRKRAAARRLLSWGTSSRAKATIAGDPPGAEEGAAV